MLPVQQTGPAVLAHVGTAWNGAEFSMLDSWMLDAPGQLQLLSLPLEVPWETAVPRHGQGPVGSDTEADTNGLLSWMLLTWSLASTTRFALIWMATWHMPCLQCLPLVSDLPLALLISCNLGNPDH